MPPQAPPPPPAKASQKSSSGGDTRPMLLKSIEKGKRLKKTQTNDRSAPLVARKANEATAEASETAGDTRGASSLALPGNAGPMGLGGLFANGMPKLKPSGSRFSASQSGEDIGESRHAPTPKGKPAVNQRASIIPPQTIQNKPPQIPQPTTKIPSASSPTSRRSSALPTPPIAPPRSPSRVSTGNCRVPPPLPSTSRRTAIGSQHQSAHTVHPKTDTPSVAPIRPPIPTHRPSKPTVPTTVPKTSGVSSPQTFQRSVSELTKNFGNLNGPMGSGSMQSPKPTPAAPPAIPPPRKSSGPTKPRPTGSRPIDSGSPSATWVFKHDIPSPRPFLGSQKTYPSGASFGMRYSEELDGSPAPAKRDFTAEAEAKIADAEQQLQQAIRDQRFQDCIGIKEQIQALGALKEEAVRGVDISARLANYM